MKTNTFFYGVNSGSFVASRHLALGPRHQPRPLASRMTIFITHQLVLLPSTSKFIENSQDLLSYQHTFSPP